MNPILLVEDDEKISNAVAENVRSLGYEVEQVFNGEAGLNRAAERDYSLVILDVNLPRLNGFEVCRALREKNSTLPILMLTARTGEVDRVLGLEFGATDYLVKPFSMQELLARVKAILRLVDAIRSEGEGTEAKVLEAGPFKLDLERKIATKNGKQISLTLKEFDLLALLMTRPGRPFSRDEILDLVWGYTVSSYESNIITHMARLRAKVEDNPAQPKYIITRRGVGYVFVEDGN